MIELARLTDARILIVDDDPGAVHLLEQVLLLEGYAQIETVSDPWQVNDVFDRVAPDIVLLDLNMPGLDGFGVMDRLLERVPPETYLPILMLTGETRMEVRRRALQAGARDFLTKPFDTAEVLARVRNLLETRFLHRRLDEERRSLRLELEEQRREQEAAARRWQERVVRIEKVLATAGLDVVLQPIVNVTTGAVVGAEALSRFPGPPLRSPDQWFGEAATVGLGLDLEYLAVQRAMEWVVKLPPDVYISVNLSPAALVGRRLPDLLRAYPDRVVVEITEQAPVEDYEEINAAMEGLAAWGVRLAVDDAGAGFASLQHILRLHPALIKLDMTLTRGVEDDPVRRALSSAMVTFGNDIGAVIIAEGIETSEELHALRDIGVVVGQGYYFARPGEWRGESRVKV